LRCWAANLLLTHQHLLNIWLLLVVGVVDLMQTAAAVAAVLVDCSPTSEARLIRLLPQPHTRLRSAAVARGGWQ
jgi:hypothetical protein